MESQIIDITRAIQLAVAPVFLLTALATLISALNTRLGRIVDRRRAVEGQDSSGPQAQAELVLLQRRTHLIYRAILAAVAGGLLVCLVVVVAFIGALIAIDLARLVAILFILALLAFIASLGFFLQEIFLVVQDKGRIIR